MALFGSDFMSKLEYLSLVSRRVFRGSLLAQRRTMQFGSGIEFADYREYVAGDDLRYLDWNVYARHGDFLLKRFQEEQDLHVYFLLDCSRSMGFGESTKFDLARQLTAALAYIALADLDRIAVVAFTDRIVANFALTRGKAQILALLDFLENLQVQGTETDLAAAMREFLRRKQRNGLAVIVSDLFAPAGYETGFDQLRHRRYEPHVIQLHDLKEANPDFLGDVELFDIENDSSRKVTVTEKHLVAYKKLFAEHQASVARYCNTYGMGCTQATTAIPFDQLILQMMRAAGAVS
ncbi:DUF58 domain-containing protein [Anatilimnocola sp. NA78]|uniref:DUF58 domain-containing protein n=1 Tax=Anatilimnocola sp. NA78 TaxID=3415683 RepID=UPI003CE56077